MKNRYCTIQAAKTKALISFAVTGKLICAFVFAYAKSRFSHDEAHMLHKSVGKCLLGILSNGSSRDGQVVHKSRSVLK